MSNLPELKRIAPHERLLSRPSWCDASLMRYANEVTFTIVPIPASGVFQLIGPNPRRWAIGFAVSLLTVGGVVISQQNRPDLYGNALTSDVRANWWEIFKYGPMIQQEWYAESSFGDFVGIWETEIGEMEQDDK